MEPRGWRTQGAQLGCAAEAPASTRTAQVGSVRAPVPRVTVLGVVTRDRPEALRRFLESYLDASGPSLRVVVFDDAPDSDTRSRNLEVLRDIVHRRGVDLRYAGRVERETFARRLAERSGIEEKLVRFALLGGPAANDARGANRNALLLETAGEMVISADDDTAWQVSVDDVAPGVALTQEQPLGEVEFFDDTEAAWGQRGATGAVDLVAAHEQLLGRTVADVRDRLDPGGCAIDGTSQVYAAAPLFVGVSARIAVTQMGYFGDPGADSPFAYLLLEGASRERLLRSEATYRAACTTRAGSRRVPRFTISASHYCKAYVLGLDNRVPLPPFFPVLRDSDGVFGMTLRTSSPDAFIGQLPYAVFHAPPGPPRWEPGDVWRAPARWRMADFLMTALLGVGSPISDAGGNGTAALGSGLVSLASLSPDDLARVLHRGRRHREAMRCRALERVLRRFRNQPAFWAEDVRRALASSAEIDDDPTPPLDLAPGLSPRERHALARDLLLKFGRLLGVWDQLFDAARALRAEGISISRAVRGDGTMM